MCVCLYMCACTYVHVCMYMSYVFILLLGWLVVTGFFLAVHLEEICWGLNCFLHPSLSNWPFRVGEYSEEKWNQERGWEEGTDECWWYRGQPWQMKIQLVWQQQTWGRRETKRNMSMTPGQWLRLEGINSVLILSPRLGLPELRYRSLWSRFGGDSTFHSTYVTRGSPEHSSTSTLEA